MENVQQNEDSPSLTKFYDELVYKGEEVIEANSARMSNVQLIEFYDYCVRKSNKMNEQGSEFYFLACMVLEEIEIVKMYKNGQLDNGMTFDKKEVSYMTGLEVTEEDIVEINYVVSLLEQRKKDKKNPIKSLVRYFKG